MNHPFIQLLIRWSVLALGVTLATRLIDGISYDNGGTLITVVLLLSLFNAVLKPLLLLFTLPFIVLTLGLGVVIINALLFLFVGKIVDGFIVTGFWPAVGGAIIVSLTNLIVSLLMGKKPRPPRGPRGGRPVESAQPRVEKGGDVIDI